MPTITLPKKGEKYNFLTLTGRYDFRPVGKENQKYVECICVCGDILYLRFNHLKTGNSKSCGCKSKELNRIASTKHGFSSKTGKHPIYTSWVDMKSRCYNKKNDQYADYGGRGIRVCAEWKDNPGKFCKWALANGWGKGLTLERKNNDGIYSLKNCMWADRPTQLRNTRRNVNLTIFGETKCMMDWAHDDRCLVGKDTLRTRIKVCKWDAEKAITTPPVIHSERRTYKLKKCA